MKMPKELKERWLAALRSGVYKQGKGLLCDPAGRYCCLGVLQKVADGKVESRKSKALPMPTDNWYDKHGICPERYKVAASPISLATMNDKGNSFTDIADFIEEKVEVNDED